MALTRDQIDAAQDLAPPQEVPVPEWGGSVFLRMMTAGDHARIGADYDALPKDQVVFYLLGKTLCEEDGTLLFPDPGSLATLAKKNPDVIKRLSEAASTFNKLMPDDVEGAAKN